MNKVAERVNWQNYPETDTPINETNLNKMDRAIDEIDDRVIVLDSSKADKTTVNQMVRDWQLDLLTGKITVTYQNGSTVETDSKLNKLAINFSYNRQTQHIIIYNRDGTTESIDISELISETEFADSGTVAFSVNNHIVSANIKAGSVTEDMLETGFLTACRVAQAAAEAAEESAEDHMEDSEAWAVGTKGGIDVDVTDEQYQNNSKYYADIAKGAEEYTRKYLGLATFYINDNGELVYENDGNFIFSVDENGDLRWEVG